MSVRDSDIGMNRRTAVAVVLTENYSGSPDKRDGYCISAAFKKSLMRVSLHESLGTDARILIFLRIRGYKASWRAGEGERTAGNASRSVSGRIQRDFKIATISH